MNFTWKKVLPVALLGMTLAGCASSGGYYARAPYPPPPPRGYRSGVVIGVAPGPGYVWLDGYQDWRGSRYAWVPGRWVRPPRPRAVWVAPHWDRHGRNQVWMRGRWR
jgi:hypothetical protein